MGFSHIEGRWRSHHFGDLLTNWMQVPRWPGDHGPSRPLGPMHSVTLSPTSDAPSDTSEPTQTSDPSAIAWVLISHHADRTWVDQRCFGCSLLIRSLTFLLLSCFLCILLLRLDLLLPTSHCLLWNTYIRHTDSLKHTHRIKYISFHRVNGDRLRNVIKDWNNI